MSYVDTRIIECTRQSSEERKGDNTENPAIFTNKLGDPITLNVGDVVSVERSFINGLGSGNAKTIQFKGQRIKQTPPTLSSIPNKVKSITYSRISHGYLNKNPSITATRPYRMGYFLEYNTEEVSQDIKLQDNQQVFTMGYYMNANQYPNYITLPRRFNGIRDTANPYTIMVNRDQYGVGLCEHSAQLECYLIDDWIEYEQNGRNTCKQRIKNDRYTLMVRDKAYYWEGIPESQTYLPNTLIGRLHPLYKPYIKYVERKEININKGFNTPQEVANQITQYLNQATEPEPFRYRGTDNKITIVSETIDSESYKPFNCASAGEFGIDAYLNYLNPNDNTTASLNYFNSFFYIGVKRPELWLYGRSIPQNLLGNHTRGMILQENIDISGALHNFYTDMDFTEENVRYWRDLFELQQNYPEFWTNLDETMYSQFSVPPKQGNTAFFHMNKWGYDPIHVSAGGTTQDELGDEGMENVPNPATLINKATMPLFIHYDRDDKDTYYEPPCPEDKYSYGWAKGYKVGNVWKIYFTMYTSTDDLGNTDGGVPDPFFSEKNILGNDNSMIRAGRQVGFDWNSTGYGNACIIPYSGYTWKSFLDNGLPRFDIAFKNLTNANSTALANVLTQVYIGAINPKCNYNEITNRFEFAEFHTQENVGNFWDAGDPVGRSNIVATEPPTPTPINPDESDICYKVNPFVNPWGYSPNFLPYDEKYNAIWSEPLDPHNQPYPRLFWKPNQNIDPYSIFDSHSGIYFDDMGVNEREWYKTLWGILGFSYNQMNASLTSANTLNQRVNFNNKYALHKPTTNAEIDTTDSKSWIVNEFGAPQFTNQIPTPTAVHTYTHNGANWVAGVPFTNYPQIISPCSSITISAENLSKQMLNPFYTIRSDIVSDVKYLGGEDSGIKLPVIGIVDRYGAEGDFYFGQPSDLSFTITKQTILGDITTSIHDPDGTYAVINENSGVIYKIQRQKPAPPRIIEDIIAEQEKKKK